MTVRGTPLSPRLAPHEASRAGEHRRDPRVVDELLDRIEHRLGVLVDRALRHATLTTLLDDLDDVTLVFVLDRVHSRVRAGRAASRGLLQELALDPGWVSGLPYPRRRDLYGLARASDLPDVSRMFLPPAADRAGLETVTGGNEHLPESLGERKQAARTRDRDLIDRLLRDHDPAVIGLLLENPRLVERDVVLVAARRPQNDAVLRLLARHKRWSSRYPVRKALAANPYTPVEIAMPLLPTLLRQDLRFIVEAGTLLDVVLVEARRLLDERS